MAIEYDRPTTHIHVVRDTDKVISLSDVHMGNSRPTNDLLTDHRQKVMNFLDFIFATEMNNEGNLRCFDLVFNGDTFDFWKAIPNPLPAEERAIPFTLPQPPIASFPWPISIPFASNMTRTYPLHSDDDYDQRFKEILEENDDIIDGLARVFYCIERKSGAYIYMLTGNHDDPAYNAKRVGKYKEMLLKALAEKIVYSLPTLGDVDNFMNTHSPRLIWDYPTATYENRVVKTHVQHGHRWDDHNVLRKDTARNIPLVSEGQILVENFLNGLHDFNLSTCVHAWEYQLEICKKSGHSPRELKMILRNFDNFKGFQEAVSYLEDTFNNTNPELEELFVHQIESTLYQMGWTGASLAASLINTLSLSTLVTHILTKWIRRSDSRRDWQQYAQRILTNVEDSATKNQVKVVLFGHTHLVDLQPRNQPAPNNIVDTQYVNTGTAVDLFGYGTPEGVLDKVFGWLPISTPHPLAQKKYEKYNAFVPAKIQLKKGPPRLAEVFLLSKTQRAWLATNSVRL